MATLQSTTIDDTGFLRIPVGTTAQRPASPELAMMRYNTDEETIEVYNGTEWVTVSSGGLTGSGGSLTVSGGYNIHTYTNVGSSSFIIS